MNLSSKFNRIPTPILNVMRKTGELATQRKSRATVVGGVVRDLIMDRAVKDADIMLEHPAVGIVSDLAAELGGKLKSYPTFLTFSIHTSDGHRYDLVTAREEQYAKPGQLPIVSPSTIENDLKRRDFTVNAMACSITENNWGEVMDPFRGMDDLERRQIKVLHDRSFNDDPTRIFRAARFAGRLGFSVENNTKSLIAQAMESNAMDTISVARRRREFEIIMTESNAVFILELLEEWGALKTIDPSFSMGGVKKPKFQFSGNNPNLVEGLKWWFSGWPEPDIRSVMKRLGFEKKVQKEVLNPSR